MEHGSKALTLLLVEDSAADVYLVREALRWEGLVVELQVAEDGEAATQILDRAESEPPDLALVDLNIPRKTGIEVLEQIRRSPRCKAIPVIVISSSDSAADRQRAFAAGAVEYFHKPSTLDEFLSLGRLVRALCPEDPRERSQQRVTQQSRGSDDNG